MSASAEAPAARRRPPFLRRARRQPSLLAGLGLTAAIAAVALLDRRLAPRYAFALSPHPFAPPSRAHLMGTDQLGRDLFTAVVQGSRTSLEVVAGVVVIAVAVGLPVGLAAGLQGGLLDDATMRVSEVVQTVPRFFLAVLVVGWFGPGLPLTVLLGLTSWPFLARVVRAETLSLRERAFVEAARAAGAGDVRILARHILPNVARGALVVVALIGSRVVLLEAGLAFLGLADVNVPSWGALLNNAQPYLDRAWWMSVFPGAAVAVTVFALNLLADGLAGLLDQDGEEERSWGAPVRDAA
ncbi:MAG TPA: ABC transporter permease [Acidimicrobiales bacterium]|nr:ABC transporter permease [Acidimicrobiales bacterium]